MKYLILLILYFLTLGMYPMQAQEMPALPEKLPFISEIEVFVGPNVSFNHGNRFIENYQDSYINNKRFLKWGYTAGLGFTHPFTKRISLNIRGLYEVRGTKNELTTPNFLAFEEYIYKSFTVQLVPQFSLRNAKWWFNFGAGIYFSRLNDYTAHRKQWDYRNNVYSEGRIKARLYRYLEPDGRQTAFSWARNYTGIKRKDFGMVAMVNINYQVTEICNLRFNLIYQEGIENINKSHIFELEEYNRNLGLSLGLAIQISQLLNQYK